MLATLRTCVGVLPALVLVLGCASVTPEQMASADYGTVPQETYQDDIKKHMEGVLFDPYSAHYRFFGKPGKGYAYLTGTVNPPTFGYLVLVGINAKNRMGGYVGEQPYRFFIKNGTLWSLNEFVKAEAAP